MEEIIYSSAKSIAEAIRTKEVSSVEVVQAYLKRIEDVNPRLNAVVQLAGDRALAEARQADEALSRGETRGVLHGVPMTIKDSLDTEGIITTGGTKGRVSFVPQEDSTVVARLLAAGAIILGKTNTPEMTISFECNNEVYGRTNNPYDLSRTPGGSSGGAAAIVAVGGSPLDMGSDTGGSIRVPAHYCGISGIKPTSGRVPRTGHIIPYGLGALDSATQIGPMSRYVEDLILTLPIICGVDWKDPAIVPMPLGNPDDVDVKGLRVAYYTDNGNYSPTQEVADAVANAAKVLSDAVGSVEEACPSALKQTSSLHPLAADGWAWLRRLLDKAGTTEANPHLERRMSYGASMTTPEFTELLERRDAYCSEMLSFMQNYDAILSPVRPFAALPHGDSEASDMVPAFSYTIAYNITGWPGAVVRVGTTSEGLPIGAQVVTRPWREDVALALARHLEGELGGWQRPPL